MVPFLLPHQKVLDDVMEYCVDAYAGMVDKGLFRLQAQRDFQVVSVEYCFVVSWVGSLSLNFSCMDKSLSSFDCNALTCPTMRRSSDCGSVDVAVAALTRALRLPPVPVLPPTFALMKP